MDDDKELEIEMLRSLINALYEDGEIFGLTAEDLQRIAEYKARITALHTTEPTEQSGGER